jgi:release factor glutamine methyltransferase
MTCTNGDNFFHFGDLKINIHPQVYEPAEDTFLLLDAVHVKKNDFVFEIGTGTGIIALSCAQKGANVVCSDINPYAIGLVEKNIMQNKDVLNGTIEARLGNLFSVLSSDEQFDIILFNPPYLPTGPDERIDNGGWFDISVDGGQTGLKIITVFLKGISKHLRPDGKGYFVFSTQSNKTLLTRYIDTYHLHTKVISSLSFENETLEIHMITKN